MNSNQDQRTDHDLLNLIRSLSTNRRRVLAHYLAGDTVSRNTNREFDSRLTFGDRIADSVAAFGGSWPFIITFCGVLIGWIVLNSVVLVRVGAQFDPYPYILLNLVLSMLAALQAPVIMMSQNRQAAKDRLDAAHDYEVNLKAEVEIRSLHEKLDELREQHLADIARLQNEQIEMLKLLVSNQGRLPGL